MMRWWLSCRLKETQIIYNKLLYHNNKSNNIDPFKFKHIFLIHKKKKKQKYTRKRVHSPFNCMRLYIFFYYIFGYPTLSWQKFVTFKKS